MKRWSREWVPETSVDCQGEVFNVLPDYVQSSGWDHRIPGIAGILARVDHGGPSAIRGLEARAPRRPRSQEAALPGGRDPGKPRPREAATPGSRGTELSFVRNQDVLWEASERYYGSNHYYSPKWVAATDAHVIETALKKCTAFKATSVRNATSNEPTPLPLTLPAAIARSNPKPQPGPATSVQPACTSSVGIAETSTVRSAIARS